MAINGKPGKVEKVDETTVRFVFPEPYYFFPDMLAGSTPISQPRTTAATRRRAAASRRPTT